MADSTASEIAELQDEMREKAKLIRDGCYGNERAIFRLIDGWAAALADAEARVRQGEERYSDYTRWAAQEIDTREARINALSARLAAVEQQLKETAALALGRQGALDVVIAEMDRRATVLKHYGRHERDCSKIVYGDLPCTCGLSAALGDPQ